MKVLVVGSLPQTRQLLRVVRTVNHAEVTHFRFGVEAIAAIRRRGFHYDLVLLEDGEGSPDSQSVADAIQSVAATTPIAFLRYPAANTAGEQIPRLVGAFEHSSRGLRLLDCRLSGAPAKARQSPLPAPAEILFEYHSPCRGKDSLHG
jgi:hypothetical protein